MQLEESVTLFDDNKVEDRFAELQVTADGITAEVGTKVGNNEVISRINQTAESVKIQANKIQIDGVITAINNDTTTTIDGDKITTGTLSASAVNASSGTFDTANIPSLSATKITTGTINIGRIPTTARNDTYITDIGDDGIRVHDSHTSNNSAVINSSGMEVFKGGTTNTYSVAKYGDSARIGKAASKHISIDATNGMQVWTGTESDSTNVAQFNDTVRVGKKNQGRIEISNGSIDVYTGTSNIQKVATFTQIGNAGGLQIYDNQLPSTPKIGTLFADSLSFGDNDDSGVFYWNSSRNDFHMSKPLSVAGHINPIGYVEDGYARYSTSIPNNTATQLAYVVLSEGTWMVVCGVRSPSNATGNRMANLSTTSGDSTNFDIIQRAVSGQPTQLQFTVVVTPTTAKTYYLNACHDAGVTLSYPAGSEGHTNFIRAVRIA